MSHPVAPCRRLQDYVHLLGKPGALVTLDIRRASNKLGISVHSVHSEMRDLRLLGVIKAEPESPGFYTVRILK